MNHFPTNVGADILPSRGRIFLQSGAVFYKPSAAQRKKGLR
jgi:hypothetical protein